MFNETKCKLITWLQTFQPEKVLICKLSYGIMDNILSWLVFIVNCATIGVFFQEFETPGALVNAYADLNSYILGYIIAPIWWVILIRLILKVIAYAYHKVMSTALDRFEVMSFYSFGQLKKSTFFKDQVKPYTKNTLLSSYSQSIADIREALYSPDFILEVMRLNVPDLVLNVVRIGPLIVFGGIEWYYYGINWITGSTIIGMILAGSITALITRIVRRINYWESIFRIDLKTASEDAWARGTAVLFDNSVVQQYQQGELLKKDLYEIHQKRQQLKDDLKIDVISSIWKHIYQVLKEGGQTYGYILGTLIIHPIVGGLGMINNKIPLLLGMMIFRKIYQVAINATKETYWINSCDKLYDAGSRIGIFDQQERFSDEITNPYKIPKLTIPTPRAIDIKDLQFDINNKAILKGVSFKLEKQEHKLLLGCNGAGKSTLMNVLSGNYEYNNETQNWKHSDFLLLCQEPSIITGTFEKNIFLNLEPTKELVDELNTMKEQLQLTVSNQTVLTSSQNTLSGGEKKKLELLKAYFYLKYNKYKPVLLVDEILANLDPKSHRICKKFLIENFKNHSMLIITHEPNSYDPQSMCMILIDGTIVKEGTLQEIQETPEYKEYIQNA